MLGDEAGDEGMNRRWGPLIVAALGYVAVGAWDWTDTVEDLARFVVQPYHMYSTVISLEESRSWYGTR